MTVDSANRKEFVIRIDGGSSQSDTSGSGNRIWGDSAHDFLSDSYKLMKNGKKENVDVTGSSSGGNNNGEDFKKGDKEYQGISIDLLHKLNPKNVSAWNMKRLTNIIRHGALSTLDEAKIAATKIFQNVAKPGSKYISLEDIESFMRDDKALKTMSLFKGGSQSKKIN